MAEKEKILKESVKYAGLGDFKEVYVHAFEWFVSEDYNVIEEGYTEKVKGDSKELELKWTASKKLTDYFRSTINLKWKILNMTDVEAEIDGKKKKMNKFGELKIEITGTLEKDYKSQWEMSPTHKFLKDTYHKYVIPGRIDEKEKKIKEDVQDFKNEMKSFLELTGTR